MEISSCLGFFMSNSNEWKAVGEEVAKVGALANLHMIECNSSDAFCAGLFSKSKTLSCPLKRVTMSKNEVNSGSCGLSDEGLKCFENASKLEELVLGKPQLTQVEIQESPRKDSKDYWQHSRTAQ